MKVKLITTLICLLMLSGCNSEEEIVEPIITTVSTLASEQTYESLTIKAIGPKCGFNLSEDGLAIHPFFNNSKHILMKRILKSDRDFWNTLLQSQSEDFIVTETENYKIVTTPNGITYGYLPKDDTWAILVTSVELNSGYVRAVMNQLCQQDS